MLHVQVPYNAHFSCRKVFANTSSTFLASNFSSQWSPENKQRPLPPHGITMQVKAVPPAVRSKISELIFLAHHGARGTSLLRAFSQMTLLNSIVYQIPPWSLRMLWAPFTLGSKRSERITSVGVCCKLRNVRRNGRRDAPSENIRYVSLPFPKFRC